MASKKVTIKGRGPEIFGRGVDLLFGEASDNEPQAQERRMEPRAGLNGAGQETSGLGAATAPPGPAREQAYLDVEAAGGPPFPAVDTYLRLAAEAFFATYNAQPAPNGVISGSVPPQLAPSLLGPATATASLLTTDPSTQPQPAIAAQASLGHAWSDASDKQIEPEMEPPMPAQEDQEVFIMPTPRTEEPVNQANTPPEPARPENGQGRKAGVPPSNGRSDGQSSSLSTDIVLRTGVTLTEQDVQEILSKLRRSDFVALDREVDALYEKTNTLLAGDRQEATVAFEILRRVRLILLKDPEHYADAEYLVNQVRARVNQIERSLEGGRTYGARIFAFQAVLMVILSVIALVTTVKGGSFAGWVAYLLGVPVDSEQLNWAVLFISTLAWGGIGGVTSALWSLYHHISIDRDYDPVENLWYYSQPVLGMVLGGIVFLIMGAGFLVVQVDLAAQEVALGARMLPAAIAVVAGFRQTMVLELIERIIAVILPSQQPESPALQNTSSAPPEEPMI